MAHAQWPARANLHVRGIVEGPEPQPLNAGPSHHHPVVRTKPRCRGVRNLARQMCVQLSRILQNLKSCGLLAPRWHESPSLPAAGAPGGAAGGARRESSQKNAARVTAASPRRRRRLRRRRRRGACRESSNTFSRECSCSTTTTLTRESVICHEFLRWCPVPRKHALLRNP